MYQGFYYLYGWCFIWFYDQSGYSACSTSKAAALTRRASGKTHITYVSFLFQAAATFWSGYSSTAIQALLPRIWSCAVFFFINSSSILPFWTILDFNTHQVQREFMLTAYTGRAEVFSFHFTGITAGSQSGQKATPNICASLALSLCCSASQLCSSQSWNGNPFAARKPWHIKGMLSNWQA